MFTQSQSVDGLTVFRKEAMNKKRCPCCNQIVSERVITLYSGMVRALIRVWYWCKKTGKYEFTRKEMKKYLNGKDNEIARWGDWIIFGNGMVYKPEGKGSWGLNMERVEAFITGVRDIPTKVSKDPTTNITTVLEKGYIHEIKNLDAFLDESGKYIAEYIN